MNIRTLFDEVKLGDLTLKNRIIMAPLTRMRSKQPGNIPFELNAKYYAQRATAGLIISEATQVCEEGQGYPGTPGIHSEDQVNGWKLVTDAVHKAGGKIFCQLWHVGRISHSSFHGGAPVAPSPIKPTGGTFTADWKQVPFETPRALLTEEIPQIVNYYKQGALNAKAAGFDGVEIHGANGYLLDQFLQDGTNKRDDNYGGSIENRARLLLEVVDEVYKVFERVGVRLSPYGTFNDMSDSDPLGLFSYVLRELSKREIAYAHLIEPRSTNAGGKEGEVEGAPITSKMFRDLYEGTLISAGGYTPELAKEAIESGYADCIAFGRWFISNPDLPDRIKNGASLNKYDRSTFYGGGEKGYTDYPASS